MLLSEWRKLKNLSCAAIAEQIQLAGDVDASSVWNWETGRSRPDADIVQRIFSVTNGEVTATDMHTIRLAWLRQHRPEKFPEPAE